MTDDLPFSMTRSGIGLRAPHIQALLSDDYTGAVGFLEAHSENFFGGGQTRQDLIELATRYPITLHGVGLSLGRADGLDQNHLRQLRALADIIKPVFVSEHLTWSGYSHTHVPDLLPIPFTHEALDVFCDHTKAFQDALGRQILIENPSNYLAFKDLDFDEPDFMNEIAHRTECGLLMDINNIAVSAHNLGYDAMAYIRAVDGKSVKQMHLAGYQVNDLDNGEKIYLDTHGHPVYPEVWDLYAHALQLWGDTPTLMEWDTDIPALSVLIDEAHKADAVRASVIKEQQAESAHG